MTKAKKKMQTKTDKATVSSEKRYLFSLHFLMQLFFLAFVIVIVN